MTLFLECGDLSPLSDGRFWGRGETHKMDPRLSPQSGDESPHSKMT